MPTYSSLGQTQACGCQQCLQYNQSANQNVQATPYYPSYTTGYSQSNYFPSPQQLDHRLNHIETMLEELLKEKIALKKLKS